ncbi:hypothetical protein K5P26_05005 [Sphingopyxis sp. XHP0097]|uniref:Uncharacterized protein n=1 Tax=Sphingopyxis jiangsuensis TaxID=2871171 RepID=A0ABS7MCF8_9SPHN|nr:MULTISPECIES: hypothetical protein [Sphingopyxis]MBY4636497.1 hypothetical protein [Sphingopyxis jiangsuensis]
MSERRSSQFEFPDEREVSARDIAAVWPCSSLVAPVPLPMAHPDPGSSGKKSGRSAARTPFDGNRIGPRRPGAILAALAAIWKNGLL